MKKLKNIGKLFIALGILNLFRKIDGFHGYGGYVDNTLEILIISLTLTTIGAILLLINKKTLPNG